MFQNLRSLVLASTAVLLTAGCTDKAFNTRAGIDPTPARQAPAAIGQSFGIAPASAKASPAGQNLPSLLSAGGTIAVDANTENQAHLVLQKSSLDKDFLFMGSMITQQPAPSFGGLKSRIVYFHIYDNNVVMIEANDGHAISQDLPQDLLLASFPIVSQTDADVTFDFNAGMKAIYSDGDWFDEDDGTDYKYSLSPENVRLSYVKYAGISSKTNTLVIDQVLQADLPGDDGSTTTVPAAVRYYINPYTPAKDFTPSLSEGLKTFGYFDVTPQLNPDGSSFTLSSKWNLDAPIVYAISANTPADFRQVISDAVLYWNSVFGKQIVQVIQLEDASITAPHPDYNIIQWVQNDAAGAAYADAQMDPRSGQILHAQIYLTSVFADLGKLRGDKDLRDSLAITNPAGGASTSKSTSTRKFFGFKGFARNDQCDYSSAKAFAQTDMHMLATLDKATALKLAQDYVRETVAHEVGHTLGLRHNFAGNLGGNLELANKQNLLNQYMQTGHTPDGVNTTSSIMDYELFEESVFTGDELARQVAHLDYDIKAIHHLYFGENFASVPAFCTDGDLGKYQDCKQFDAGRSIAEYMQWNYQHTFDAAAVGLLNTYITDKVPDLMSHPTKPIAQVVVDPKATVTQAFDAQFSGLGALSSVGNLIAVQTSFPFVNAINKALVLSSEQTYLGTEFTKYGGLATLVPGVDDNFADNKVAQFTKLLATPGYGQGTYGGVNYNFTDDEKATMIANAKLYFAAMQDLATKTDLQSLAGQSAATSPASDSPAQAGNGALVAGTIGDQLLAVIRTRIEKYVFTTTADTVTANLNLTGDDGKLTTQSVKLPVFKFSSEIRTLAANLLNKGRSQEIAWGAPDRAAYSTRLQTLITQTIGVADTSKVDVATTSQAVLDWIAVNGQLMTIISGQAN